VTDLEAVARRRAELPSDRREGKLAGCVSTAVTGSGRLADGLREVDRRARGPIGRLRSMVARHRGLHPTPHAVQREPGLATEPAPLGPAGRGQQLRLAGFVGCVGQRGLERPRPIRGVLEGGTHRLEVGVGGRVLPADAPSSGTSTEGGQSCRPVPRSLAADRRRDAGSVP